MWLLSERGASRIIPHPSLMISHIAAVLLLSINIGCRPPVLWAPLPADVAQGNAFVDISSRLGAERAIRGWGGMATFDYDNDGDIDLLVTNGPGMANRLFQNDGLANFTEVGQQAGVDMTEDNCAACAVADLNNDGWLDLIIARQRMGIVAGNSAGSAILLNNGPDAAGLVTFSKLDPSISGLTSEAPCLAVGVGDLDNDGMLDLVFGRYDMSANGLLLVPIYPTQPNELWRCSGISGGVPHYEKITGAGIEGAEQPGFSPDTQDQRFIPGTLVVYMTDVDQDGWLDFFDLHDIPGGIDYFHNNGDMTFTRLQVNDLNKHGGWMGMAGGDYDGDGDLDYFLTNVGCDFGKELLPNTVAAAHLLPDGTFFHKLLRNDGGVLVDVAPATTVTPSTVLPQTNARGGVGLQAFEFGFGTTWIDADNRGMLDLYWIGDLVTELSSLFRLDAHGIGRFLSNNGDGSFTDQTAERGLFDIPQNGRVAFGQNDAGRSVAACDLNGDGFLDLILSNASMLGTKNAEARIFLNPAVTGNHWLTVRLQGMVSNRFGIGARVRAVVAGKTYVSEVVSTTGAFMGLQPQAHFGIGAATMIDTLEVRWSSGMTSTLHNITADQRLTVSEM